MGRRLCAACARLDVGGVATLLGAGADARSRDAAGATPLHMLAAAAGPQAEVQDAFRILQLLLRHGAQVIGNDLVTRKYAEFSTSITSGRAKPAASRRPNRQGEQLHKSKLIAVAGNSGGTC